MYAIAALPTGLFDAVVICYMAACAAVLVLVAVSPVR